MDKKEFKKKYVTWNMRGRKIQGESKYKAVEAFILNHYSVIALQEAGPDFATQPLPNTTLIPKMNITNPDNVDISGLSAHNWRIGTETRNTHAFQYFLDLDKGGHRVNLAMVSAFQADRVILLQKKTWWECLNGKKPRPILGIQIGNKYFFNIHANADGGSNSADLVRRVRDFMAQQRNVESWMIMGDFNREPESLENALDEETKKDVEIKAPQKPTHCGFKRSTLDYAVFDAETATQMQVFEPTLPIWSDHSPVGFAMLDALQEEERLKKERLKKERLKREKERLEKEWNDWLQKVKLEMEQKKLSSEIKEAGVSPYVAGVVGLGVGLGTAIAVVSSSGIVLMAPFLVGKAAVSGEILLYATSTVGAAAYLGKKAGDMAYKATRSLFGIFFD